MQSPITPSIRLVFDRQASLIEELAVRRRENIRRKAFEELEREDARQEKVRKDEKDQKEDAEFLALLRETGLAESEKIAEFTATLDRYDTLTVEALQENERTSAEVRERIRAALASAVQLPDGRHVFKTEDGALVFDEHGKAVSPDEIRPDDIDDSRPRYELYRADLSSQDALAKKRDELLTFQDRLDAARETLGKDGLTGKELKALEHDIDAAMPSPIRKGMESSKENGAPDLEMDIARSSPPRSMTPIEFQP